MSNKDIYAKENVEKAIRELRLWQATRQRHQTPPSHGKVLRNWGETEAETTTGTVSRVDRLPRKKGINDQRTTENSGEISYDSSKSAQSGELIGDPAPYREKVGFAAFLHARRVPDVVSRACRCGCRLSGPQTRHSFFVQIMLVLGV